MDANKMPDIYRSEEFQNVNGIHVTLNAVKATGFHRHDFYEFDYVLEGEGTCTLNEKSYRLKEGDLSFITPLDYHSYGSESGMKIITVHFQPGNVSRELAVLTELEACTVECPDKLGRALTEIYEERTGGEYHYLILKNLLERTVILFLRVRSSGQKIDMPPRLIDAVGYIHKNFSEEIDLDTMSRLTGYSSSHFCKLFKKYTQKSFVEYLNDIRASHAKNMLMSGDLKVADIAYECGFGDVRSFYRAFSKKFGVSPKIYKKEHEGRTNET